MKFNGILAALIAAAGFAMQPPKLVPTYQEKRAAFRGRSRTPGPRGRAGDKLARMALEGRIGLGGVR